MEAFSDGIFAIASTLLVLDLAIPPTTSDVAQKLRQQWPMYLAYLVSFTSIGQAWLNHSVITDYLDRADSILTRLNLVLLFLSRCCRFPPTWSRSTSAAIATSASPSRCTGSTCWRSAPPPASSGITRSRRTWSGRATGKAMCGPSPPSSTQPAVLRRRARPRAAAAQRRGRALPGHRPVRDHPVPDRRPAHPVPQAARPNRPGLSPAGARAAGADSFCCRGVRVRGAGPAR
jgi:hypothetical protein